MVLASAQRACECKAAMTDADQLARHWYSTGTARLRAGKWAQAAAAFEDALSSKPDYANARFQLGVARQHLDDWAGAASCFEAAVTADNGRSHGFYRLDWRHRLAFALRMLHEPEKAKVIYSAAAECDPTLRDWLKIAHVEKLEGYLQRLWWLVDRQPALADEHDALLLIEEARPHWSDMPPKWWFHAYSELYRRRWPRAAYAAKAAAASVARFCSADLHERSVERQMEAATAFADAGDYVRAQHHAKVALDAAEAEYLRQAVDLAAGIALLKGDFGEAERIWQRLPGSPEDMSFGRLVAGKSVAVVAPGETGLNQGEEIDSFDLVVRTNFRDRDVLAANARRIGRRIDICYFNGNFEPQHRDRIIETLAQNPIEFVVLRFDDGSQSAYNSIVPVRISHLLNVFYRMNSYAVPKIVFDLLRFRPARIKIFNADFFLGRKHHYDGYLDYDIDLTSSLLGHDVIRNIRLMREWLRLGLVEGDSVFLEVLSRSEADLLDRIGAKLQGS